MKNTKRIISVLLLCAILLTSFTACGKKDNAENSSTAGQGENAQEAQKIEDPKITYLDKTWAELGLYSEGLIAAKDKTSGLWGYIDKTGEYVIEPAFYDAFPFSEGLAAVKTVTGFYSFIDKMGKEVIKGEYSDVFDRFNQYKGFYKGYAHVNTKNTNTTEPSGLSNAKEALIDTKGNIIKAYEGFDTKKFDDYENCGEFLFKEGDIGSAIYDFKYDKIADCSGEFCSTDNKYVVTKTYNSDNENDKYTYRAYDGKGNVVFDEKDLIGKLGTDCEYYIKNEYVIAEKRTNGVNTCAVYDLQLNEIIAPGKYRSAAPISDDLFIMKNNADNWAIIDKTGKEYLPFESGRHSDGIVWGKMFDVAMQISENGIMHYVVNNEDGSKSAKYFDIQTKEVKDSLVLKGSDGQYIFTSAARGCSYDNEKSGIYYLKLSSINRGVQSRFEVFNSKGESIGELTLVINRNRNNNQLPFKEDCIPFLKENIAPVQSPNGGGVTLAIIG